MSQIDVTLTLSEALYARAHRLAQKQNLPVEQVLVQQLEIALVELPQLSADVQAELDALSHLSDEALWTIAQEQMPAEDQSRMQKLMAGNNRGSLSEADRAVLERLVDQGQRLMLRKAKAMALLTERGHVIDKKDLPSG